ncbi:hypothetical protein FD754_005019 [Muntiacus muntjak]|uniref:MRG domain-containing protein n=1 Tax=Muntiacus muntjak TaxID=9888 RepID=A0A5N3WH93_MUNMU|nr:hypothetical protein FD754_005019 [Muntiacus muntjak]
MVTKQDQRGAFLYEPNCVKVAIKGKQNFKKPIRSSMQRERPRRAAPGKKTSGLQQKNVEVKTKKNKTSGNREGTSETSQPQEKRAQVDPTSENEETFMSRVEDLVTWQKQLFYLPAKKNVDSILEDYANYKTLKETQITTVSEILTDLSDAPMSQVYGAPLLLRSFNVTTLFSASTYEVASPEYHQKAV